MASEEHVLLRVEEGVGVVTLNLAALGIQADSEDDFIERLDRDGGG